MEELIVLGIIGFIGIVAVFLPKKAREWMARNISLQDKGVRYSSWRRDRIDTLTNVLLFLSLLFSIAVPFIPGGKYVYLGLYGICFFLLLGQTYRITDKMGAGPGRMLVLAIVLMCGVAAFCAAYLVSPRIPKAVVQFISDVKDRSFLSFVYLFSRYEPVVILQQMLCTMASFYVLWAQFKYMRLEHHYKAVNLPFFWFKVMMV
ncbi:MAG: hypothetical protein J6D18_04985, partial [Erysipelotrichaceae bacterium]|nr:hypothetical protein [Erysipelotrichaceae bacterium]